MAASIGFDIYFNHNYYIESLGKSNVLEIREWLEKYQQLDLLPLRFK
jgi:hypothetical protein